MWIKNVESFTPQFVGPKATGIPNILWVVMNSLLFSNIAPLISHFEHGHTTLAQSIESFQEDWWIQALNNLSFGCKLVNSNYQTPENHCKFKLSNLTSSVKGAYKAVVWTAPTE